MLAELDRPLWQADMLRAARAVISMFAHLVPHATPAFQPGVPALRNRSAARPTPTTYPLVLGSRRDRVRTPPQRIAATAVLCHQLLVLNRSGTRPRVPATARSRLVLLANRVRAGQEALLSVQAGVGTGSA